LINLIALPAEGTSFFTINAPNVAMVAWKLAEDGKGTILRLQETAGKTTNTTIHLPHSAIHSANLCNAVEDKLQKLNISGNELSSPWCNGPDFGMAVGVG
jgi:alpha-mannosidase